MIPRLASLLACVLFLAGCSSLSEAWNGRLVTENPSVLPSQVSHTVPEPTQDPAPIATASPPPQPSPTTMPPPTDNVTPASPMPTPPPVVPPQTTAPCAHNEWVHAVQQAQDYLRNLTRHHVQVTVAGQANGSYYLEERLYDLDNYTLSYSSQDEQIRFTAVDSFYSYSGQASYRGRDDAPPGPAARRLERLHDIPALQEWQDAAPERLTGSCTGAGANLTATAQLNGSRTIELQIEAGLPMQATIRAAGVDLQATFDYHPAAPRVDESVPARALNVTWQTQGNQTRVTTGDTRLLDGHLVLHALDENGYTVFAMALTAPQTQTTDGATLIFQDDGDGYWGPGDTVAWSGRAAHAWLFDSWAGAFTPAP